VGEACQCDVADIETEIDRM